MVPQGDILSFILQGKNIIMIKLYNILCNFEKNDVLTFDIHMLACHVAM